MTAHKAFVLGAGLGTRLRPLTESLPKPLIPVFQKPLISYAFDHLIEAGFNDFIVNTHHCPEAYDEAFPGHTYRQCPLTFRFEPILLETAGGIANIADLLDEEPLLVYNGDILTDLPLQPAIDHHQQCGNAVTLVLRSSGHALHIAWDAASGKVTDIHNRLDTNSTTPGYQFTGIYIVSPEFLQHLTPGKKESVIPIFLNLIRDEQSIGAVLADQGHWWDLGSRDVYLEAHAALTQSAFPAYGPQPEQQRLHPDAQIDPSARICPLTSIGAHAVVEANAQLEASVLWAGAHVTAHSSLKRCILRRNALASGDLADADL